MLLDKERRGIPYLSDSSGTGPRWTKEPQWRQLPSLARVAEKAAERVEAATAAKKAAEAAIVKAAEEMKEAEAASVEAAKETAKAEAAFKDASTTDLTTGIADWRLDDGSLAPAAEEGANPSAPFFAGVKNIWYRPTGKGKWLGNAYYTEEANAVYGYTLSFEVTLLPFPASNLESPTRPSRPHSVCM